MVPSNWNYETWGSSVHWFFLIWLVREEFDYYTELKDIVLHTSDFEDEAQATTNSAVIKPT